MVKGNVTVEGASPDGAHLPVAGPRGRSIRDVAQAAGVSITTVSHALHGTRHVAASTRVRIQSAASELGYQPNRLARGLRNRGRTRRMPISHLRIRLVSSSRMAKGCGARRDGLVLASTPWKQSETRARAFTTKGADGLIVAAPRARWPAQSVAVDRRLRSAMPITTAPSGEWFVEGEGHSIMSAVVTRGAPAATRRPPPGKGHRRIRSWAGHRSVNIRELLAGYR